MNWLQKLYNVIKTWNAPPWFHRMTEFILVHIIIPSLKMCGEMAIRDCQRLIREAADLNVSNEKKFEYVFEGMRQKYTPKEIKDSILNFMIELIYQELTIKKMV